MEKTLSCAEFEMLLADWIDETLAAPAREAERAAFVRHIESCAACAALLEDASSAVAFMQRAADVEIPPALVSKILQATNSGWEFKLRGRGVSGWINRTFAPVLRPRVAAELRDAAMPPGPELYVVLGSNAHGDLVNRICRSSSVQSSGFFSFQNSFDA